jgi:DNA invertase Pin-like site-specific DNA recombinase
MIIGYIRVSKHEQNFDLQIDALKKAGCEKFFSEKISGAKENRKEFENMLNMLRKGDVVTVWRIDRLGRTTLQLIKLMTEFREKGVEFKSIMEGIDTSTQMGRMWFMLSSIFAENERNIIRERTNAGLESARSRGKFGGRPAGLSEEAKRKAEIAGGLYLAKKLTVKEICTSLGIKSNATFYRYLKNQGIEVDGWMQVPKSNNNKDYVSANK